MAPPLPVRLDEVTGVLLAGGRSSRMGREKALLPVEGEPLVERAARALGLFPRRLLILDQPGEGPLREGRILPGWPRVYDRFPGTGPLGALATALAAAETPWVALAACDMPFLTQAYYRALVERLGPPGLAVVPRWEGGAEPLAGAYHRDALPVLVEALSRGVRRVVDAVAELPHCPLDPGWLEPHEPQRLFRNINSPEEYRALGRGDLTPGQRAYGAVEAVPLEEGWRRLREAVEPLPEEVVPLAEAWGRHAARELRAPCTVPGEPRAALDGYALRSADVPGPGEGGPVWLPVAGQRAAGPSAPPALPPGAAYRVATGAVLPEGADAVVRWEEVQADETGARVSLARRPQPGEGVIPVGEAVRAGELVLDAGRRLDGAALGRLAAAGVARVPVRRRPRVWVIPTGSELIPPGAPYRVGAAYESNGVMLAGWLRETGVEVTVREPVPDRVERVAGHLKEAVEAGADLVVTAGGISAGPYDLVAPALVSLGGTFLFRQLQIHPGKPCTAALLEGRPVIALPGSPGAAAVGYWLLVPAVLARLQGGRRRILRVQVPLVGGFPRPNRRRRFLWARLLAGPDGAPWAEVGTIRQRSSALPSLQGASCLVEVPAGAGPIPHGGRVTAWLLGAWAPDSGDESTHAGGEEHGEAADSGPSGRQPGSA